MQPQERFYRQKIINEVEWLLENCPEINAVGILLSMKERLLSDKVI